MFKQFVPLRIETSETKGELHDADALASYLANFPARDPDPTAWGYFGFAAHENFGEAGLVYRSSGNVKVINFEFRERALPGRVIKDELRKRLIDLTERQGHKIGRKQRMELKDEVIAALLPKSMIKTTRIFVLIVKDYLIVCHSSMRLVDLVLETLSRALDHVTLALKPMRDTGFLQSLACGGDGDPFVMNEQNAALKDGDRIVRLKHVSVLSQPIQAQIAGGLRAIELGLAYEDKIEFSMTDKGLFRRLRFSDILMERETDDENESEVSAFDAEVSIIGLSLADMLKALSAKLDEDDEL